MDFSHLVNSIRVYTSGKFPYDRDKMILMDCPHYPRCFAAQLKREADRAQMLMAFLSPLQAESYLEQMEAAECPLRPADEGPLLGDQAPPLDLD